MAEITCTCPHCGQDLNVDSDYAGEVVACPACNGEFAIPEAPEPAPAAPAVPTSPPAAGAGRKLILPGAAPPRQPQQPQPQQQQVHVAPQQQPHPAGGYAAPPPQPGPPAGYSGAPPGGGYPGVGGAYPYGAPGAVPAAPGAAYPHAPSGGGLGDAFADPLAGQPRAINALGQGGALVWGLGLCGAWLAAAWILAWRAGQFFNVFDTMGGSAMPPMGGDRRPKLKFSDHLEILAAAAIPVVVLALLLLLYKAVASKRASLQSILFTTGMVTLPLTGLVSFVFLASFLELKDFDSVKAFGHLMVIVMVVSYSAVILLLKAALVSVLEIGTKAAFWLAPTTLLAVAYLSSWIGKIIS